MNIQLQTLKGYQNTTPGLQAPGLTITFNGSHYNVRDILPEDLDLVRIARSLSRQARYLGNMYGFYSVAQHSVRGAEALLLLGLVETALEFLFHDAAETFISDISAPLKRLLSETELAKIEEDAERVIAEHFGYDFPYSPVVRQLDINLAQEEMTLLNREYTCASRFDYWTPERAEEEWLLTYDRICTLLIYQGKNVVRYNKDLPEQPLSPKFQGVSGGYSEYDERYGTPGTPRSKQVLNVLRRAGEGSNG